MQLIRGLHNIRPEHQRCVATIGNFDGVHVGHRTILEALKQQAFELNAKVCVITFEPQPREYFQGDAAPPRLSSLREKLELLAENHVDQVLCLPFNDRLRSLSADDFVLRALVEGLDIRYLIVGDDFRYGCDRKGDFSHLEMMGERYGFEICDTQTVLMQQGRISSTRIRNALAENEFAEAEHMLGRPFTMIGRVVKGQQLGRTLGFPTANIRVCRRRLPLQGVFAVRTLVDGHRFNAVANLGIRPSVSGVKPLLEVHMLDFKGDLYDRTLRVEFVEKIRDEQKFESLEALRAAIANDIEVARKLFINESP
ncbi:bifunctional riboflavin kinase/FAD synthetase [Endozoicomonas elysicola]|uniref:Riboflavin biosynthesis protein n=1 Tax=Endozoicomonas elysicola TaxID=305900 RepID=A0A081KFD4_9GAMM|nr:bifunctional riboflavin kinase/FAD synthetase [Endozoicomonas elysicola]KEI72860.1 FMN adenylyltransferase [Endozoicomonas elysicola]